ncbi:MAG: EAL domain-containing protein [bacterium]|nr:EAL domain-containing protein [bacterium]
MKKTGINKKKYTDEVASCMTDSMVMFNPDGMIEKVNQGLLDLLGYKKNSLIGRHISSIFAEEEIFNEIDEGICLISKDFRIKKANEAFLNMSCLKKEEIIGQYCYKITHGKDYKCQPPEDKCPISGMLTAGEPYAVVHTHFDNEGKKYLVNVIAAVQIKEGREEYYLHMAKRISERAQAGQLTASDFRNIKRLKDKLKYYVGLINEGRVLTGSLTDRLIRPERTKWIETYCITKTGVKIPVSISGAAIYSNENIKSKNSGNLLIKGFVCRVYDIRETKWLIKELDRLNQDHDELLQTMEEKVNDRTKNLTEYQEAILNMLKDLDESKENLEQSRANFLNIVEKDSDGIIILDKNGIVQFINSTAKSLFGDNINDVLSKITAFSEKIDKTLEVEIIYKDGRAGFAELRVVETIWEDKPAYLASFRDITSEKDAQFEIKKLSTVIDNSTNMVFITNREGKIENVNSVFEILTGYLKAELLGKSLYLFVSSGGKENEDNELMSAIKEGRGWRGVSKNRKKDGKEYWCYSLVNPISDETGKIVHFLVIQEDITERMVSEKKIKNLVSCDELTGLFSRSWFMDQLDKWIAEDKNFEKIGILSLFNIDGLRVINNVYGHSVGNDYLRGIAELLQKTIVEIYNSIIKKPGEKGIIGRLGGDEFAVFMPDIDEKEGEKAAEYICRAIENFYFSDAAIHSTISMGCALYPESGNTVRDLLRKSDTSMYRAKKSGRNQYCFFKSKDHDLEKIYSKFKWKEFIQKALKEDRVEPWYQPILDINSNKIHHYEVLARIVDENGNIATPAMFMETAENTGLIYFIDKVITEKTLKIMAKLKSEGKNITFCVNLSEKDLENMEFISFLKSKIMETGADPKFLVFEITETAAIKNMDTAVKFINLIKAIGCGISLDDFGAGFTSFVFLKEMNVDYIKIDGSFVKRLEQSLKDQLIVKAIADMAKGMGIMIIAEFVERKATLELLKDFGIDFAQGYYIDKPSSDFA